MFDATKETNDIINFIKEYFKSNNLGGVVLGISGGKDSAVVSALFTKALGKDNVIGLTLPCHSNDKDIKDAKTISEYYGFKLYNINLTNTYDAFKNDIKKLEMYNDVNSINSDINVKPRLRMSSCYYMAALLSSVYNKTFIVAGTSNKCELFVGYFTKGGDSVCDVSVISDFTVSEVVAIGEVLKVPPSILYKKPSDGLSNMTDEEKLGVTYKDIETYMINSKNLENTIRERIEKLHKGSRHKFNIPTYKRI